jgi:hypothetical protein
MENRRSFDIQAFGFVHNSHNPSYLKRGFWKAELNPATTKYS